MTETEQKILTALLNMEQALATIKTANPKPNLLEHFQGLDTLTAELPKDADPELLHFLYKKSYEKARMLLEGRNSENAVGSCR
jgi:hypothetical protein